jgi:pSer/pThr/pTyr-binding forkhead associated (FHA) protein
VFGLRSAPPLPSDGSRWELSSPIVSREHCALEYDARSGRWSVTDSGSTFGTAVGGCKLSGGEAVPLRPGSELLLGSSLADSRALGFVLEPDDC